METSQSLQRLLTRPVRSPGASCCGRPWPSHVGAALTEAPLPRTRSTLTAGPLTLGGRIGSPRVGPGVGPLWTRAGGNRWVPQPRPCSLLEAVNNVEKVSDFSHPNLPPRQAERRDVVEEGAGETELLCCAPTL